MKQRSFFSFLIVGVVVLLLTGCSYLGFGRGNPLSLLRGGSQANPAAAMFVPKQAPAMVSLLVNPDALDSFWQMIASGERRQGAELSSLKTSLLADTGLDYQRDIKPWIDDEITLAVTSADIDRDASNGRQTGYLMAIATKNAQKSREFLELLFTKRAIAGTELMFEQYKGIKLISDNQQSSSAATQKPDTHSDKSRQNSFSGAVVGDRFILFANHPKILRDAINNVQAADLNLTSSSQYQKALTLLPADKIGLTYLNLPSVAAWQGLESATQKYDSQIIALEVNRKGLLAETTLLAAPDQEIAPPPPTLSQTVGALQYIPTATQFSISGSDLSHLENTNLNQLWQQSTQLSGASSSSSGAVSRLVKQPLAELQARWGIELPKDIFSWVQGEYALGLLPHEGQTTPDFIFVAEKLDAAVQGISRLDAVAQQQGLSVAQLPLQNQKISAWTQLITAPASSSDADGSSFTLKAKVQGVHTGVGNYEIFTTSVGAMDEALKAGKNGALVNSPNFQDSVDAIPKPNQGYLYLDWPASRTIVERQLPILKLLEVAGKPFFNNLRSLTVSSYGSETGAIKGGVFFQLKRE
jgi:hypothetical protein